MCWVWCSYIGLYSHFHRKGTVAYITKKIRVLFKKGCFIGPQNQRFRFKKGWVFFAQNSRKGGVFQTWARAWYTLWSGGGGGGVGVRGEGLWTVPCMSSVGLWCYHKLSGWQRNLNPMSSGRLSSWRYLIRMTYGIMQYLIRMTYDATLSHLYDKTTFDWVFRRLENPTLS